ncbi:MAG: hypothetical protein M1827_004103 [Pycnora praestabilis]|nr:MAG: hypothetical protein M1827_004103 [Pycnora praestabilis]
MHRNRNNPGGHDQGQGRGRSQNRVHGQGDRSGGRYPSRGRGEFTRGGNRGGGDGYQRRGLSTQGYYPQRSQGMNHEKSSENQYQHEVDKMNKGLGHGDLEPEPASNLAEDSTLKNHKDLREARQIGIDNKLKSLEGHDERYEFQRQKRREGPQIHSSSGSRDFENEHGIHEAGILQSGLGIVITTPGLDCEKINGGTTRMDRMDLVYEREISLADFQRHTDGDDPTYDFTSLVNAMNAFISRFPVGQARNYTQVGMNKSFRHDAWKSIDDTTVAKQGFCTSVRPGAVGPLLNVNPASTAFYKSVLVSDFIGLELRITYDRSEDKNPKINSRKQRLKKASDVGDWVERQAFTMEDQTSITVANDFRTGKFISEEA